MWLAYLWRFLHLLFGFSFVGALILAEWNGRAARTTTDWSRRAALWGVVRATTQVLGLGALLLLGIIGNLLAVAMGLPLAGAWMRMVNGLWLVGLLLYLLVALPVSRQLVSTCEAAAREPADVPGSGAAESGAGRSAASGYPAALARWRTANILLSIFFVVMLALMVLRPLLV